MIVTLCGLVHGACAITGLTGTVVKVGGDRIVDVNTVTTGEAPGDRKLCSQGDGGPEGTLRMDTAGE